MVSRIFCAKKAVFEWFFAHISIVMVFHIVFARPICIAVILDIARIDRRTKAYKRIKALGLVLEIGGTGGVQI